MTQTRIGIVGSGGMARHHADRFSKFDTVALTAIASRNIQTGSQLAGEYNAEFVPDWRDLLHRKDVDGILVCTHNDSHGEITIEALRADKHVFTEYPLARRIEEGEEAVQLATSNQRVLRVSHPEVVSSTHQAIKQKASELGRMMLASFFRLTPGRGARPEILFNIPVSGPPAHFFVYHIYPIVDIFGCVEWVEAGAAYEGLTDRGQYRQFVNTVNVGFMGGGIGQWTWAGGIEINAPEQHQRYVLTEGTLINSGDGWRCSTQSGIVDVPAIDRQDLSLQALWLSEIESGALSTARADTAIALEAIRVSLCAEQSIQENRRIVLR